MEPNDLPIVVIPLQLPVESAAELVAFLHNLTDTVERHYFAQLQQLAQERRAYRESESFDRHESNPPF